MQNGQRIEIKPNGSRPSGRGPAHNFTGSVVIDPLFDASAHTHATGGLVTFEPGARTAWHRLLRLARPGSLDNATVERVVRVFTEEVELLAVYSEQLDRWRSGSLTVAQRLEVGVDPTLLRPAAN